MKIKDLFKPETSRRKAWSKRRLCRRLTGVSSVGLLVLLSDQYRRPPACLAGNSSQGQPLPDLR